MFRGSTMLLCFLVQSFLMSQVDTILTLDSVVITALPLRSLDFGSNVTIFDAEDLRTNHSSSVADFLSDKNLAFIKSYGQGTLATSSFRGGSAGQSLVLWNGLPVHSPMLGQLDFSLLPTTFVDEIRVQPGGNSSLWGSGAVAGAISLDNHFKLPPSVFLDFELGSFNNVSQNIQLRLGRKKLKSATRILYEKSRNNFPYHPFAGGPKIRLDHAKILQKGVMQSLEYALRKNQKLAFHFWHQNTDREIPPLLTQTESLAQQQDRATRMAFIFKGQKSRSIYEWKLGYFTEQNKYQDEKIRLESANLFTTWMTDFAQDWIMKPWLRISLGTTHSYTSARADAYSHRAYEYRGAIFLSSRVTIRKLLLMAALRKQWADNQSVPLIPLFSFQYPVAPEFMIRGKLSRDYRLPTLNDRFWMPGGNPALKSENGWSQEVTFSWDKNTPDWSWSYQITGYNRLIQDWIIWIRKDGQSFFSPENIAKVWSRGLEQSIKVTHSSADGSIVSSFNASYTFLKSTNEIAVTNPVLAKGQQLIYTPRQQASVGFSLKLKNVGFSYKHLITGSYQGINQNLSRFDLGTIELNMFPIIFKQHAHLFMEVNNIWNREYQVIENRPMPGRNYRVGLKLKILH